MSDNYTPTTENIRSAWLEGYPAKLRWRGKTPFDRWLAAHDAALRAEWEAERSEVRHTFDSDDCVTNECDCALAEQGTEEPEWEYGYGSIADAEAERPTMRRRKAGPWVPVDENGSGR